MRWLKLAPAISSIPEPKFRQAVQDHFLKLFWPHQDGFDWDVAAFYRSRDEQPIYYFSPGAADLLTRFGEYVYEPCDRPDSSAVTLQIGSSLAVDTTCVELPDDMRPYPELDQEFETPPRPGKRIRPATRMAFGRHVRRRRCQRVYV